MTRPPIPDLAHPPARQTNAIADLDADLQRAVRRTSYMRQLFYVVVLLVALAGQVTGAVSALGIPVIWAIPAVCALELGGIVVLQRVMCAAAWANARPPSRCCPWRWQGSRSHSTG